jgi:16S rRNA pseudouridine516 synthase
VIDGAGQVVSDRKLGVPIAEPPSIVHVDGRPVTLFAAAFLMQHKPTGVVTALRDSRHPTAYALLREAPLFGELRPIGRLDLDTSGLLLWTTEGALIQRLTHPKRRVPRTYQAALAQSFGAPPARFTLEDGHRPEIADLALVDAADIHPALHRPPGSAVIARITIVGGAYHEVRRIFAALGSHVLGLCRTRFGDHELPHELPPAGWRRLAQR